MGDRAVVFAAWATTVVVIPDDVEANTPDEIREWAEEHGDSTPFICHQCGKDVTLGEFEADTVITADGTEYDVKTGKARE
ncbi:hypothetical protein SEA_TARDUS_83 [Gordonia phage Tardus]|uniref:Uncharacterized protein n=1 Tax=Gordonia phage Tardus TaxID=2939734 RepID=A0A9E7E4T1_9CAUD|nr:hypothetical protein SEA_TARDUS_83 [Gordonia phage Tardus]